MRQRQKHDFILKELFLICALAPAPLFSGHLAPAVAFHEAVEWIKPIVASVAKEDLRERFLKSLLLTGEFLAYTQRRKHSTEGRTLVIDGKFPLLVKALRSQGIDAFGLAVTDDILLSSWHAIGLPSFIPFQEEMFYVTYWVTGTETLLWGDVLKEVSRVVEPQGFFVFNEEDVVPLWGRTLQDWRWEKLPIKIGNLSIFQKPFNGNVRSFSEGLAHWAIKKRSGGMVPVGVRRIEASA